MEVHIAVFPYLSLSFLHQEKPLLQGREPKCFILICGCFGRTYCFTSDLDQTSSAECLCTPRLPTLALVVQTNSLPSETEEREKNWPENGLHRDTLEFRGNFMSVTQKGHHILPNSPSLKLPPSQALPSKYPGVCQDIVGNPIKNPHVSWVLSRIKN